MTKYSRQEKIDIIFIYSKSDQYLRETVSVYISNPNCQSRNICKGGQKLSIDWQYHEKMYKDKNCE